MGIKLKSQAPDFGPGDEWGRATSVQNYLTCSITFLFLYTRFYSLRNKVNGTQLAAGYNDGSRLLSCGVVILWSYPSGRVLFNLKNQWNEVNLIAWNPFKQNIFTTRDMVKKYCGDLCFFPSFPDVPQSKCPIFLILFCLFVYLQ